jgi:hypothetical protein
MKTNPSASRWHFCVLSLLLLLVAPVAQATLWTPAYLLSTQLKNWYDASDVTTLWQDTAGTTAVTASGQTVLLWKDKSVNGNHLSISSGGPAYTTGVMNSLPIVRFSGNKLANLAPSMGNSTNNFTVIGVFTVASNNNWDNWLNWGNGTGDLAVYLDGGARTGGSVGSMEFAYNGGTGAYTAASVTAQPAFLFVGGVNQASSPSLFSIWKNGTAETSRNPTGVTAPSTSLTHFLIGPTSGTSQVTHGDIAELIVVNTGTNTLADSDRQYIEGYLANKWWGSGSSNPLPSGHPYKNSAPNVPVYNIVATNGVGGTVLPGGTNGVVQGNNQIYTITPLTGYAINDVLVDGSSVGAVSSYTFTNVQTTHTIGATFTALSLTAPTNLVVASVGDGSVNLTWALSTGSVMAYNVERATTSGGPYTTIASLSSATYYHDITVAVGTNYYYVISATNYATNAISSQASVTPQINPNLWKPSTLGTNLVNWYDAADASTLWQNTAGTTAVTANGQTVLLWQDKSGNGNHLSISSSGPAYTTGVMNSLPVVYFNGNTMANTAVSMGNITNNFTVIGVFQAINDSGGWNNWIIWGNGNVGGGDLDVYLDGGARTTTPAEAMEFAYSGGSGAATTNAVTGQPAFLFIGGVNQATSPSLFSIWMNGGFQQAQNPLYATTPSSSLTQFRIGQSSSSRPHGNIAELIMVNTGTNTLSNADRQNIEGYLANKWWGPGANNLLPSGHPYKNSAPTIPVYGITATNGIGGTLTPTGTNYVLQGNNQTFTIAPLTGYAINDVLVDGSSVGAVSSYTFTNVQTTHTIGATFTALSLTIPTNLVASAGQGTVALTWSAATGPVMAYNVGRATVSGGPYTTVASLVSTSYVDPFVINGTNYFYVVTVTNYAASASTSEASATPQINPNLWKPLGLGSNLVNWYDAADTSTLWQDSGGTTPVTANGNTVLCWKDKSGNGNHLTSSSGPACTTGVMNSLPVLNFASNTMANLAPNMGNITNNFTVIGVFQVTSDSGWDAWVKWGNGDVGGGDLCAYLDYSARATTPAEAMEFAYDGGTGAATTNAVTGQPAFLFIGGVNQATSPSQFSIWMNGGFQQAQNPTVVTTPCSSLTQFRIGPSTSYQKPHGNLAELIVVNTGTNTLATADRQKIEGYLANKWWGAGSSNPLPSGHPYKNSAPTLGSSSVTYGGSTTFTYDGSAHTPTITVAGSTGAITTNYAGTGSTSYSSVNVPTNAGTYFVSNTVAADVNYFGTTNSQAFTINQASNFVGASSTKNPSGYKDSVSYTATLPADAAGSVVFSSTSGPISTNSLSSGSATSLSITNLPRGTNIITVVYLGDGNYVGSTTNLDQIVTNHTPVVNPATYTRNAALNQLKIAVTNLLSNASDADGDTLALAAVSATTNNAFLQISGGWVLYYNTNAVNDQFTYTVSDGYGGTNSANVTVNVDSTPLFGQTTIPAVNTTSGTATLNFAGIPGYSYSVLRSTNLTSWTTLRTTNAPAGGLFQFIDTSAPMPSAYYQLQYNP